MKRQEVVFLTIAESEDLVERIASRAAIHHTFMSEAEKQAMTELLSDVGVKVEDIINVSNLADNYAINAQIVTPDEVKNHEYINLAEDSLFQWEGKGGTHYCLTW